MEATTTTARERIAANVRAELGARHLRQRHMAADLGWSEAKVSRMLSGSVEWPSDEVEVVAAYFGTTEAALYAPRGGA